MHGTNRRLTYWLGIREFSALRLPIRVPPLPHIGRILQKTPWKRAHMAMTALYALQREVQSRKAPYYDFPSLEITSLHAGKAFNTHATLSTFSIDRRMVPGETFASCEAEIRAALDELKKNDPEMDYELKRFSDRPHMEIPEDDPFIVALLQCVEEVTGKPAKPYRRHGGSDGGNIWAAYGTPFPNLGAADDKLEPTRPNEKIPVEDYLHSIEYYMLIVVKMLG